MSDKNFCPECGAKIPHAAPAGQCPQCMIKAGFETADPGASGFDPPSVERLSELFPQLEILELVGKGGMGAVYKARQPSLDRLVAIKILPLEVGRDPAFADRFVREARAMARLSHPNIVAIYDFGQTDGIFYFVMDYVDGANLRETLQAGKLTPEEALAIVPQICDALQFAHDEGVVHRDIKPENVLIDTKGRVKIADFGLAKLLGEEPIEVALTHTNQVMGTLRYMAPEQMHNTHDVDHRADIYSLGVVFYELLTGDVPMGRFELPSRKASIDVRLDEVVLRALAQEPDQRYQHASEVKTDVEMLASKPAARKPRLDDPHAVDVDVKATRLKVKSPAMGLIVVGVLTCLTAMMPLFLALKTAHDIYDSRITFTLAGGLRQAVLLALVLLLPSLGILMTWGGWMMKHLQSRTLAITASVLALLPCQPVFILGPIFGIWSLIVLNRSYMKAAFKEAKGLPPIAPMEEPEKESSKDYVGTGIAVGIAIGTGIGVAMDNTGVGIAIGVAMGVAFGAAASAAKAKNGDEFRFPCAKPPTADFKSWVRSGLKVPAIGLLIAGVVNLIATLVVLLLPVLVNAFEGFDEGSGFVDGSSTFAEATFLSIIIAACSLAAGTIVLIGAARMLDLQSYPIALTAAVVAILPVAMGFPISLPFGVWALLVLSRRDVKTAFSDGM